MANETRKIAVLVGSVRRESINRRLAVALGKLAPSRCVMRHVRIDDLPLYNQDRDDDPPAEAIRLKQEIEACDALLFVTPEYNRSIPGVLKNAIDTGSRPYGKNSFAGKPGGVIGASVGAIGTAMAQQHLRNVLAYLEVATLGQPEAFIHFHEGQIDEHGNVNDEMMRKFLQRWVDAYVGWIDKGLAQKAPA